MRPAPLIALFVILLALPGARGADQQSLDEANIELHIAALADADSGVRSRAAQRLAEIGPAARPAIIEASRGDNPEQRAQAALILRKLPWMIDADPPEVRELLTGYGESNDMTRASIIGRLHEMRAASTLVRLLGEEPSDLVRWMIVYGLYESREPAALNSLRALDPADGDAPALLIAGRMWIEQDRAKGLRLLRRAVDADSARPSQDLGLIDFAYDQLVAAAMEARDFERAAEFLRRQVPRELSSGRARVFRRNASAALPRLLALHEYFGPLRDYAWDCRTWGINGSERPRLLEAMTTRLAWLGFKAPLPLGLTSELSISGRYTAGTFLAASELPQSADLELDAAANLFGGTNEQRARMVRTLQPRFEFRGESVQDMLAELHWRRARLAQDNGDIENADKEVQRLADLNPTNTDSAIRIILWLKETNRTKEAKAIFNRIYDSGKARLERSANKAGARNDLAWLCARSGERLEEAVTFAQQAVDEMPDVAAFLDTLAEAKYRTGARAEAIQLETRALQLSPDTKFMKEQLERFKAGKP